jgi:hypothetical protein
VKTLQKLELILTNRPLIDKKTYSKELDMKLSNVAI